jgi:platelet-activating factor acetylhydrolase IB subunit alpha
VVSGCRDKLIKLWNSKDGRCIFTFVGHDNWVTDLVFHPSGRFLLSSSDDKSMRIWDLNNGRIYAKLLSIHDHFVTCIDMKHKHVVTGSVDKTVKIWGCR